MRKPLVVGIIVLAAAIGGLAWWRESRAPAVPAITTAAVTRGSVVETVEATGTLQATTTVQVGTQVSGTIKALHVDFNSRVRRGQVIAELEPALFQAQVAQARASLLRLQADADRASVQLEDAVRKQQRAEELFKQQLISRADLEAAQMAAREAHVGVGSANAQIAQARASLQQTEVNLAHTIIAAPIDGIVVSRNVDVGQTVAASMQAPTLFVLARDLTSMQVNASIAESDIGRIRQGQSASFRVDAYPDRLFTGQVTQVRLDPVVQQNVVSYVTTIAVTNPDLLLKPGMTATVLVETARADDVLRIPSGALRVRVPADVQARLEQVVPASQTGVRAPRESRGTTGATPGQPAAGRPADVWVLSGDRLRRVPVRVGVSDGRWTALVEGELAEGAAVVTRVTTTGAPAAAPAAQSPLLPQRGRGGGASRGNTPPR